MGIGRDLNHPPTKWEFMLQILNSSRCPEKKGNCTVLSTCFFQLRFGFLKLKLQLTLKQTNIRNGTPPVSHQSFCRFNYLFFPPVRRLQIHCLDVPIAPAKRKTKLPGLTVNIPSFVQQMAVFELGFQKIRSENFLG